MTRLFATLAYRVAGEPRTPWTPAPHGLAVRLSALTVAFGATAPALAQSVQWSTVQISPRAGHAMAYDAARGVTVLFGGLVPNNSPSAETWEWNGTIWNHRVVDGPSARAGPSARDGHAMAFDSARAVTVLFGGFSGNNGNAGLETWEWNGAVWTLRATSGPPSRNSHAMAYEDARAVIVLFGGTGATQTYNDTWEWNGAIWTRRMADGPSMRAFPAMAFDAARATTVLFGGTIPSTTLSGETWGLSVSCSANCDGSTAPPVLTVNDFVCFQSRFAAGDSYANCDGSTAPPILNVNDFICFQSRFATGCP